MFGMTLSQWWSHTIGRPRKGAAPKKTRAATPGRTPVKWVLLPDRLTCSALTKSEARADFKKRLGLSDRLPVGKMVVRAGKSEMAA
jgi:hypothetical protein